MPRADVTWGPQGQEITETEALRSLLGADGLTDDRLADLTRARQKAVAERGTLALQEKVIYHALHAELGTWDAVAEHLGMKRSTIWAHAHAYLKPGEARAVDTGTG